ncbi:13942_t:CDS:2 [Ambispora leptoticha]|uniref:13942_t:CDS:1 n=1 Tax=Ambispora leptoticha TaxID=144679 RepID=A0A9N9ECH4_9GLOM|nr:13942_t:CDS:2 [Ambispora leptoticha]
MTTLKKFVAIALILAICLFALPDAIPLDYSQGDQSYTVGKDGVGNANAKTGSNGQSIALGGPATGGNAGNGGNGGVP